MRFEKNVSNRRLLVQRLEALTGKPASYTQLPRCAYLIGPFAVEKDGHLEAEVSRATRPVLQALLAEGLIQGDLPSEARKRQPVRSPEETAAPRAARRQPLPDPEPARPQRPAEPRRPSANSRRPRPQSSGNLPTVAEWFQDPRCDFPLHPSSDTTRRTHEGLFRNHVAPVMGDLPLDLVTGSHIQEVYARMEVRPYSPNTIQGVYVMMAMIFNSAIRAGLIKTSPTRGNCYTVQRDDLVQGDGSSEPNG